MSTSPLSLTPLGTGTAYTTAPHAQSGYLVTAGEHHICLDLGAGALPRLLAATDPGRLSAIAITHAHPDHCVDLFALHVYLAHGPGGDVPIPLYTPPGLAERFHAFGGVDHWDEVFATTPLAPPAGGQEILPGILLRWQEVPHLEHTYAFRIERGGRSICFGADCGPNDQLAAFADGADVLILECSFGLGPVPEGVPHLAAGDVARIAAEAGPGRVLLTHCYPEHDRDATLAAVASEVDCPVAWAQEGVPIGTS